MSEVWTLLVESGYDSLTYNFSSEEEGKKFIEAMKVLLPDTWKPFSGPVAREDQINYGVLYKAEALTGLEQLSAIVERFELHEQLLYFDFYTEEELQESESLSDDDFPQFAWNIIVERVKHILE